ncbi:hypothetical protein HDZ31DRAFT_39581 [Schizophyllum fasciatum]
MNHPRYVNQLIQRMLYKTYGKAGGLSIPPNFVRSKTYKDVLSLLDSSAIPTRHPFGREEWLSILNASDALLATVCIMRGIEHPTTSAQVKQRITLDLITAIWDWFLFFHPDAGNFDEDTFDEAMARFGWSNRVRSSKGWLYSSICTLFCMFSSSPEGAAALLAIPGMTSYLYDLWWYCERRFGDHEPADTSTASALQALDLFIMDNKVASRVADEILAKGTGRIRALIRRVQAILRMPRPFFHELGTLVEFIGALTRCESVRPLLRPMLWVVSPIMDMIEHPAAWDYQKEYMGQDGPDATLLVFLWNAYALLNNLRPEIRGAPDIARLVRGGLLRRLYLTMKSSPEPFAQRCIVSKGIHEIIGPGLIFPSVAKAVRSVMDREDMAFRIKGGLPAHQAWNEMTAALDRLTDLRQEFLSKDRDLRHCHNEECAKENNAIDRIKRCSCGKAYYCSRPCRRVDWNRHKEDCHLGESAFFINVHRELIIPQSPSQTTRSSALTGSPTFSSSNTWHSMTRWT